MSETESESTDLDWLAESILIELRGQDEGATTPELVELTGAGSRHQIRYRLNDKLEPQGLVETQPGEDVKGSQIPPTLVKLTTRGDGLAGQLLSEGDEGDGSLSSEINRLQAQVNRLESTVESQQETIEKLVEGHDDLVGWLEEIEDELDER